MAIINKFSVPTKFDYYPFGTIWYSMRDNPQNSTYYVQLSKNKEEMDWQPMENLLVGAFKESFNDEKFISTCLGLFTGDLSYNNGHLIPR